jgi:hypothetical protein
MIPTQPAAKPPPTAETIIVTLAHPSATQTRLVTTWIALWGERLEAADTDPRTFIVMSWGERFDIGETLADLDALLGFTATVQTP